MRDDPRGPAALGVRHDVFTSERAMVAAGGVEAAIDDLEEKGLIYRGVLEPPKGKTPDDWEPRRQMLFRSTPSATTWTGRCRNPTAAGPISPTTSPTTPTRWRAASTT